MERLQLTEATMVQCVRRATEALEHGRVVLYPTDTLYGLGADAFEDETVDAVYAIKGRDAKKPIHCIVADMAIAQKYAEVSDDARLLAKEFLPGPLTIILKKKPNLQHGIGRNMTTIGIRIPDNDFCLSLAAAFGRPFTATSANRSYEPPAHSVSAILQQLGARGEDIQLAIEAGEMLQREPSTVVDLSREEPIILREGAIPSADIWNAIRAEA